MHHGFVVLFICAFAVIGSACSSQGKSAVVAAQKAKVSSADCPVTQPPEPAFIPPSPYPAEPPAKEHFWYGSPGLWTLLLKDGRWWGLPRSSDGYTQKLAWWREGYDPNAEPEPELSIKGKRLDAPAPTFEAASASNGYTSDYGRFMMTGFEIPTLGCWEITGHYKGQSLSFVVWIAP